MIVEQHLEISRPPSVVFGFLGDVSNWPLIDAAVLEVTPSGPVTTGSSGTAVYKRPGTKVTTRWEITQLEPDERLEVFMTGSGYTLRETVDVRESSSGTELDIVDTLEPTNLIGRVMVAISGRMIRRDLAARSDKLKALLEAVDDVPTG